MDKISTIYIYIYIYIYIRWIKYQPKSVEKYMSFLHCISSLKVCLVKNCEIQPSDLLFLVVFISFYISRYYFSQIFRT